jgi:SAM-dependent methyltransferase
MQENKVLARQAAAPTSLKSPWTWYASALWYRFFDAQVACEADRNLFTSLNRLGHPITNEIVGDFGCGPAIVVEKLVAQHAKKIVAIDYNGAMLWWVKRLRKECATGQVVPLQRSSCDDKLWDDIPVLVDRRRFDIILFKRSLYIDPEQAPDVLFRAWMLLARGGVLAVVHPEKSEERYFFRDGHYTSHTILYKLNRRFSEWTQDEYQLYTKEELFKLVKRALPKAQVTYGVTTQSAFNIVLARKR